MKNFLYILRLAGTLLIITALIAAALAGVNAITEERIAAITAEKMKAAIAEVLGGEAELTETEFTDETGIVTKVYASERGYAVEVKPGGFGGTITMMVGVDADGKVLGISIVTHSETASLGAVAADKNAAGQSFRDSFVGLTGEITVSKDGGQADTITGATITSRAVAAGVSAAVACVENLSKEA